VRVRAAKSPRKGRLILWFAMCATGLASCPSHAADDTPSIRNNFGGVGLIEMPSARMADDGELSIGASFFKNTQHYNFGFQILPWLEASFRYSGLRHFDPAYSVYYDRSFAVKARLWEESAFVPAIAVGINDLVGTGVYSGEYLVASKRFGNLDASLGIGWGRLGGTALFSNPLDAPFPAFKNRDGYPDIIPGTTSFNTLFRGPSSGLFGGVVWHTPIKKLSLIVEYSSDRYRAESMSGNFHPQNQLNYGISYQASDNITAGLSWLYGRSIGGSLLFQLNPAQQQYAAKLGPAPLEISVRSPDEQQMALQTLVYSQSGKTNLPRHASANRGNFVDALWQQNGVRDVELSGNSLTLVVASNLGRHCITTAQLVQAYSDSIKAVAVREAGSSKSVQCTTALANSPAYQSLSPPPALASEADIGSIKIINAVGTDSAAAMREIRLDARNQNIVIEAISLTEAVATVYYNNTHYFLESDAIDRLTRILMNRAPPAIERFRLIATINGVPQQEFDILRGPEERKSVQSTALDLFKDPTAVTIKAPPMQNPILAASARGSYPRFSWNLFPQLRQELFDPDNPFALQLTAAAQATLQIAPGLSVDGEVETSLFDNFSRGRLSESTLPHVRSDFLKYFAQGRSGIGELETQYRFRFSPNVFATLKAGYLESMFAGGGGEVLWRPENQRWALGADAYEVWQRGFDRLLDLQHYHVFTGHVSLYYASPWHELNFMLSAGQYLAGDRGLTFQVTRRFSTGVEIGAFFTKTNISSAQFGEGSFDKGIVIRIPLGWALPIETQGQWGIDLRPVQRDGGQRLYQDATLFDETRRSSFGEISKIQ